MEHPGWHRCNENQTFSLSYFKCFPQVDVLVIKHRGRRHSLRGSGSKQHSVSGRAVADTEEHVRALAGALDVTTRPGPDSIAAIVDLVDTAEAASVQECACVVLSRLCDASITTTIDCVHCGVLDEMLIVVSTNATHRPTVAARATRVVLSITQQLLTGDTALSGDEGNLAMSGLSDALLAKLQGLLVTLCSINTWYFCGLLKTSFVRVCFVRINRLERPLGFL
eukprot:m.1300994 g.1300994  ORF g.1300994 m.1300994 type:complete len:224 (-) comp24804_c0_seq28:3733-4404(-)